MSSTLEGNEEALARLASDVAGLVTPASGVFSQKNRTGPHPSDGTIADLDIDGAGQVDDKLATRGGMKVEVVVARDLAKHHALATPQFRDAAHRSLILQIDGHVFKVTFTIRTGIDTYNFHAIHLQPSAAKLTTVPSRVHNRA